MSSSDASQAVQTYQRRRTDELALGRIILQVINKLDAKNCERLHQDFGGKYSFDKLTHDIAKDFEYSNPISCYVEHITGDWSKLVHRHPQATSAHYILSHDQGLRDPTDAYFFQDSKWRKVEPGELIIVPENTHHGFAVADGGELFALGIERERGIPQTIYRTSDKRTIHQAFQAIAAQEDK